jgi:hypothetical protein
MGKRNRKRGLDFLADYIDYISHQYTRDPLKIPNFVLHIWATSEPEPENKWPIYILFGIIMFVFAIIRIFYGNVNYSDFIFIFFVMLAIIMIILGISNFLKK